MNPRMNLLSWFSIVAWTATAALAGGYAAFGKFALKGSAPVSVERLLWACLALGGSLFLLGHVLVRKGSVIGTILVGTLACGAASLVVPGAGKAPSFIYVGPLGFLAMNLWIAFFPILRKP